MYDSIDGLKAGILKDVNISTSNGTNMNPDYEKLGELAKQIVIATMQEGEQTHPGNEWQTADHIDHAMQHLYLHHNGDTTEDHIGHALTRCVIIKEMQK